MNADAVPTTDLRRRVMVLGATGTIGQATVQALLARGHDVVCFVRPRAGVGGALGPDQLAQRLAGATLRYGDVTASRRALRRAGVVPGLAHRRAEADAWAIDHQAHVHALAAARAPACAGGAAVGHLRAEAAAGLPAGQAGLRANAGRLGADYSIVRPTAFFKSLSGQVDRVRRASPSWCSATAR
jgi:divinyl chlorophyllide a 8-vinyl-reductase